MKILNKSKPNRLTTADALQLQWKYCRNQNNFKYKKTQDCQTKDLLGFQRLVFDDRICDGIADCPNAEDEGDIRKCSSGKFAKN